MISVMGCFRTGSLIMIHPGCIAGTYTITTREVCTELTQAVNTLTQRMGYVLQEVCVRFRAVMLQLALQNIMENMKSLCWIKKKMVYWI